MVEKPPKGEAPSTSIISGRYVLGPEIFKILESDRQGRRRRDPADRRDEEARRRPRPSHGVRFDGKTHDCGSKLGFLLANVAFALKDGEVSADFKREAMALLGG